MALLQLLHDVVGDGLHGLHAVLDGEPVDVPDLDLPGLDLISQEELEDLLGILADVGTDPVPSADSDDELVQLGVVRPIRFVLQSLDPLKLLPEEGAVLFLGLLDCLLVDHFDR